MYMDNNKLSNAEMRIILVELENEYEALKNKVKENLERMEILDKKYNELKDALNRRTKGKL